MRGPINRGERHNPTDGISQRARQAGTKNRFAVLLAIGLPFSRRKVNFRVIHVDH